MWFTLTPGLGGEPKKMSVILQEGVRPQHVAPRLPTRRSNSCPTVNYGNEACAGGKTRHSRVLAKGCRAGFENNSCALVGLQTDTEPRAIFPGTVKTHPY
jgi:hypothetical protein